MDYLIPANTKKGQLILGLFRPIDMIIFGIGIGITLILLLAVPKDSTLSVVLILLPAMSTGFLVIPVPNYHNMLTIIVEAWNFITTRQKYVWKGWCFDHGEDKK